MLPERKRHELKFDSGFTLLEIMIAIAIFATVVTLIFGSYNMIFGNIEAINRGSDAYEMAKSCLERMTEDLNACHISLPPVYSPDQTDDSEDPYRIVGENGFPGGTDFGRLRFASFSHLPLNRDQRTGIAEIVYYVQETENDQYILRRSDRLEPFEPFEEKRSDPILCKNIRELKFNFFDMEGEKSDTWDSESDESDYSTPKAIHVRLAIGDDDMSHVFETMITLPVSRKKKES